MTLFLTIFITQLSKRNFVLCLILLSFVTSFYYQLCCYFILFYHTFLSFITFYFIFTNCILLLCLAFCFF
jgi:hypothetical protein